MKEPRWSRSSPDTVPDPKIIEPTDAIIKVTSTNICGSDLHLYEVLGAFMNEGDVLGHEPMGIVREVGSAVTNLAVGDRVAVGWFGGNCGHCTQCRKGDFIHCENGQIPSWHYPGGYAESVTAPASALARIPEGLSFAEAAPMACAGVTVFHGLRETRAKPGDRVAVLGVGGLGHLGVQFARAMGFETVAIARGADKKQDALDLGAHHYIDSKAGDVSEALQGLGGVQVVLATAANSQAMADTVGGLLPRGELIVVGVTPDPLPVSPLQLITPGVSITGHPSGTARDVEDAMKFAVQSGVRARIQELPLAQAAEAYAAMDTGKARYRMVLTV